MPHSTEAIYKVDARPWRGVAVQRRVNCLDIMSTGLEYHSVFVPIDGGSEIVLPVATADETTFGSFTARNDVSSTAGNVTAETGEQSKPPRTTQEDYDYHTPPTSAAAPRYKETSSSNVGHLGFPPIIPVTSGLSFGVDNAMDPPQGNQPSPLHLPAIADNTSPVTGVDCGDAAMIEPPSPEYSLALLEETIASAEFAAQLEAARAAERIRADGAAAASSPLRGAATSGPHADELDSMIAAQIAIEIRKDARRRGKPPTLQGSVKKPARANTGASKRSGSAHLAHTAKKQAPNVPMTLDPGIATINGQAAGAGKITTIGRGCSNSRAANGGSDISNGSTSGNGGCLDGIQGSNTASGPDGKVEKIFKCENCPKVFERRYNLKVHMRRFPKCQAASRDFREEPFSTVLSFDWVPRSY